MVINEEILKGKWLEIKGEVQKVWGNLTSDELEKAKGDMKSIAGLVQQKYGEESELFQKKLAGIMAPFQTKKETVTAKVKKNLKS